MNKKLQNSPFPPNIAYKCLHAKDVSNFTLHPQEKKVLSPHAAASRIKQFTLGRAAAHTALSALGLEQTPPILKGESREPLWPDNIVGSISHSGDYAICAAGYKSDYKGIGIDLEKINSKTNLRITKRLCHASEEAWIKEHQEFQSMRLIMLFSAKEALFKAVFPLYRKYFWYQDAKLEWQEDKTSFSTTLSFDIDEDLKAGSIIDIKCEVIEDYVLSGSILLGPETN